jgi:hypothetical protein
MSSCLLPIKRKCLMKFCKYCFLLSGFNNHDRNGIYQRNKGVKPGRPNPSSVSESNLGFVCDQLTFSTAPFIPGISPSSLDDIQGNYTKLFSPILQSARGRPQTPAIPQTPNNGQKDLRIGPIGSQNSNHVQSFLDMLSPHSTPMPAILNPPASRSQLDPLFDFSPSPSQIQELQCLRKEQAVLQGLASIEAGQSLNPSLLTPEKSQVQEIATLMANWYSFEI